MAEKVPQPRWVLFLRAARALLAVIILGLCAYTLHIIAMSQAAFNIFVCVFTFLVTIYIFVSELSVPQAYNKWLVLALENVSVIFWLAAFASLAALAGNVDACLDMVEKYPYTYCYARRGYDKRDLTKRAGSWDLETAREWYGVMAGAAGLGAICFILSIILLVIFARSLQRQRQAAAESAVGGGPVPMQNVAVASNVPEKMHPPPAAMMMQQPLKPYPQPEHVVSPPSSPPPPGYVQPQTQPVHMAMPYQHTGSTLPSPQQPQQPPAQPQYQYQYQPPPPPQDTSELNGVPATPHGRSELTS